jgi:thiol-disulfide isomerase/thioredoxin
MMKKLCQTFITIALILCLASAVSAQSKAEAELVSEELMNTEFQPLSGSTPIRLADYRGGVVVLVLWASWCGPCRMAVEGLNDFNEEYSFRHVEVLGLTTEDPAKEFNDVQSFLDNNRVDFKLGWLEGDKGKALLTETSVVPQNLVIAGERVLVKRFRGWQPVKTLRQLRKVVDNLLAHPPVRQ